MQHLINSIDAWVIWYPFLSAAKLDAQAQVLIDGTAFPKSYAFYIGNPKIIQQHPHAVSKVLASLNAADQWILQHQDQALSIYTQSTGLAPTYCHTRISATLKTLSNLPAEQPGHSITTTHCQQLSARPTDSAVIQIQSVVWKDHHSITP